MSECDHCIKCRKCAKNMVPLVDEREVENQKLHSLPDEKKQIAKQLLSIHLKVRALDTEYFQQMMELNKKFMPKYESLFQSRRQIVSTESAHSSTPTETQLSSELPNFWLEVLQRSFRFISLIKEDDIPILKHLVDIKTSAEVINTFSLEFHFSANVYFMNKVLRKTFHLKPHIYKLDFIYPIRSDSEPINWFKGKDVTKNMSFFNFFHSSVESNEKNLFTLDQKVLKYDWELAKELGNKIIPNAILFYLEFEGLDSEEQTLIKKTLNKKKKIVNKKVKKVKESPKCV